VSAKESLLERQVADLTDEIKLLSRALEIKAEDFSLLASRDVDKAEIVQAASAMLGVPEDARWANETLRKECQELRLIRELNNKELVGLE
jgi:hypothetical protein